MRLLLCHLLVEGDVPEASGGTQGARTAAAAAATAGEDARRLARAGEGASAPPEPAPAPPPPPSSVLCVFFLLRNSRGRSPRRQHYCGHRPHLVAAARGALRATSKGGARTRTKQAYAYRGQPLSRASTRPGRHDLSWQRVAADARVSRLLFSVVVVFVVVAVVIVDGNAASLYEPLGRRRSSARRGRSTRWCRGHDEPPPPPPRISPLCLCSGESRGGRIARGLCQDPIRALVGATAAATPAVWWGGGGV